jgi:hypothetical protein
MNVIILSVVMLNVIILSVVMLNVIILSVVMLNVIILSVIMLNVVILSVVMLSLRSPFLTFRIVDKSMGCSSMAKMLPIGLKARKRRTKDIFFKLKFETFLLLFPQRDCRNIGHKKSDLAGKWV